MPLSLSINPIHGNSLIYYMKLLIHFFLRMCSNLVYKKEKVHDSIIMFPVNRLNVIKQSFDPPPFSHGVRKSALVSHPACNSEGESDSPVVNTDCFSGYDPSILGNIDPDINYLNSINKVKDTPYYNDQSFAKKFKGNNDSLSMLHLNIRSIPDHFFQLTSLLNDLNIELKIIAISETWIKPFHINYNIININLPILFLI